MIVISEFMDITAVKMLQEQHSVIYNKNLADNSAELLEMISNCRALIVRNRTQVNKPLLEAATELKCVGRLGVGLDNIDLTACKARNIEVYPATGANNRSVAEYVIGTSMILLRRAYSVNNQMFNGEWPRSTSVGEEIFGKKLGLVGLGSISQLTAKLALSMGMETIAFDPYLPDDSDAWKLAKNVPLDDLLAESDVISVHVPLTDNTRNLIGATELSKVHEGAVIINTSRGGIIDETALIDGLNNHIGGAALDVFEFEPLNAEVGQKFASANNLILTPHIAGVTQESNKRVSHTIAEKVMAHLEAIV